MTRHVSRKNRKSRNQSKFSQKPEIKILLEAGTLKSMQEAKQATVQHLKFQWDYYAELARQRNDISEEITAVLIKASIPYDINKFQRAVKYKYGLHPFCTNGSLAYIGGRFNTGSKVNTEVPSFPALYLAEDKDTALQEHLGQQTVPKKSGLTSREIALTASASETIVSVSGHLDRVLDLRDAKNLEGFINLVKNFTVSKELISKAKQLGLPDPGTVKTANVLLDTLLHPDWRQIPSSADVPSNSQIFGHLVYVAGIEGILYPSKFTGKLCIVIFPRNFNGTDSFIVLDDRAPHKKVPTKIDTSSWRLCEMDAKEIIS